MINLLSFDITQVLYPALIMFAVALVFGILLTLVSMKFNIERNIKIDEVENLLAKSNCGACGRAGCAAFAEALIKGEADISECNATAKENKIKIASILDMDGNIEDDTVAVVHCNGGSDCKDKFEYQGYGDCESSEKIAGGKKLCERGCMGNGSCTKDCPHYAIKINEKGVAVTDKNKCTSCGVCISFCPKKLIARVPKTAAFYVACSNLCKGKEVKDTCKMGCIACGICVKACEFDAIKLINNIPEVDYSKCTSCMKCVEKCPVKVLVKM